MNGWGEGESRMGDTPAVLVGRAGSIQRAERSQAMEGGARAWETEAGDGQSQIRSRALVGKSTVVRGVVRSEAQPQRCLERWHPLPPPP